MGNKPTFWMSFRLNFYTGTVVSKHEWDVSESIRWFRDFSRSSNSDSVNLALGTDRKTEKPRKHGNPGYQRFHSPLRSALSGKINSSKSPRFRLEPTEKVMESRLSQFPRRRSQRYHITASWPSFQKRTAILQFLLQPRRIKIIYASQGRRGGLALAEGRRISGFMQ